MRADPPAQAAPMPLELSHLRGWVGRTEAREDVATLAPLQALSATLDRDGAPGRAGEPIPPCWHWLYFLPCHRQSRLGPDGHPERGGFLPPVPLPRRMWAGSRIRWLAPLRLGQALRRVSRIDDVQLKQGRGGPLVLVKVSHEISGDGQAALVEEHGIVYRAMPRPDAPAPEPAPVPAPEGAMWKREIAPSEVLLFRYSALTFNGHRIHYDRRYATEVEGYPGLVVHGPLLATLLLELVRQQFPQARVESFSFRALRPLFDTAPFHLHGRQDGERRVKLWATTPQGGLATEADATLA